jgi:hypothetical protein
MPPEPTKKGDGLYNQHRWEDHNLLLRLEGKVNLVDAKLENISTALEKLNDGISDRIKELEAENKLQNDRLDTLENWRWYILGGGIVFIPILIWLAIQFINHITTP